MQRGFKLFKCTNCGHRFMATDIEYMCTIYSCPQRCPKCGSIRTRPVSIFPYAANKTYKAIWESLK